MGQRDRETCADAHVPTSEWLPGAGEGRGAGKGEQALRAVVVTLYFFNHFAKRIGNKSDGGFGAARFGACLVRSFLMKTAPGQRSRLASGW